MNQEDFKEAAKYFLTFIELDENFKQAYYNLGLIYVSQEKYYVAKNCLFKQLNLMILLLRLTII